MTAPIIDIEGGDGNGKSTALHAVRTFFEARLQLSSFDAIEFEKREGRRPQLLDIAHLGMVASKILITGEPTYVATGAKIRAALIEPPPEFNDPVHQAHLYAQDRREHLLELVIQYLSNGGPRIIRSRGLLSSLAYQAPRIALQEDLSLEAAVERVMVLDGNALSILYAPELCLVLDLPSEEANRRMESGRTSGLDHFERDRQLQQELRQLYHDPVIQAPFRENGTQFAAIDTSGSKEATREQIFQVLRSFYP